MKKVITILALVAVGSFANANPVLVGSVKCSEYNQELDVKVDYIIHTDIAQDSGAGIIVSNVDDLSVAYNVKIKTKGDSYLEAISDSELWTEVISVYFGDKVSGVRTVTLKNSTDGNIQAPLKYSLACEVIDVLN